MSRHRSPRHGDGTAWLVADVDRGDYLCYWYAGRNDDRLVAQARAATATEAVAWGRLRTTRVRIRTSDACTYWAGVAPRPEGLSHTWSDPDTEQAALPSPPDDAAPGSGDPAEDPVGQMVGAGAGGSSC